MQQNVNPQLRSSITTVGEAGETYEQAGGRICFGVGEGLKQISVPLAESKSKRPSKVLVCKNRWGPSLLSFLSVLTFLSVLSFLVFPSSLFPFIPSLSFLSFLSFFSFIPFFPLFPFCPLSFHPFLSFLSSLALCLCSPLLLYLFQSVRLSIFVSSLSKEV